MCSLDVCAVIKLAAVVVVVVDVAILRSVSFDRAQILCEYHQCAVVYASLCVCVSSDLHRRPVDRSVSSVVSLYLVRVFISLLSSERPHGVVIFGCGSPSFKHVVRSAEIHT